MNAVTREEVLENRILLIQCSACHVNLKSVRDPCQCTLGFPEQAPPAAPEPRAS